MYVRSRSDSNVRRWGCEDTCNTLVENHSRSLLHAHHTCTYANTHNAIMICIRRTSPVVDVGVPHAGVHRSSHPGCVDTPAHRRPQLAALSVVSTHTYVHQRILFTESVCERWMICMAKDSSQKSASPRNMCAVFGNLFISTATSHTSARRLQCGLGCNSNVHQKIIIYWKAMFVCISVHVSQNQAIFKKNAKRNHSAHTHGTQNELI